MDGYAGKRIVVTGGAGFIGSHLVDALLAAGARRVAVVDSFFLGKEENLAGARRRHGDAGAGRPTPALRLLEAG